MINCNREVKLLKLKANYNFELSPLLYYYCNCEAKLRKLKANYNYSGSKAFLLSIVIAR